MTTIDPELLRLLIQELERHLPALAAAHTDPIAAQRAVHALKGSAGLAGERDLASALDRLQRRMRDGDARALSEAELLVRTAIQRLVAGETAVVARWPLPPDDLRVRPLDPLVHAQYAAEVVDRIARIDDALGSLQDPLECVAMVYRQVHTMKGASSAVDDDPMSWFCHGLEDRLKAATSSREAALAMLKEMVRWRPLLGALLDDPEAALRSLRSAHGSGRPRPPSVLPDDDAPRSLVPEEGTVRVAAHSIDRLLDRFEAVDRVRDRVAARAARATAEGRSVRHLRARLVEALRLIGPPRPWGAPAAALLRVQGVVTQLERLGEQLDDAADVFHESAQVLRESVSDAKRELSGMRQTPVGRIFARLTTAIESEARRMDRVVIVQTKGADETIDRRLAEQIVEPCLQLVRNSVAHGIESPDLRAAIGKPRSGTIRLHARKLGNRLRLSVSDDGAGVDVWRLRDHAVRVGVVTPDVANAADHEALLTLLFLPGFSTRDSSDMLAGRGIGLDIARNAIQRLGGTLHLSSAPNEGFSARIDVPAESGVARLIWVQAGGESYAFLTANVARVRVGLTGEPLSGRVAHLAVLLGHPPGPESAAVARAPFWVELDVQDSGLAIGVDQIGETEEHLVRPLTPLLAGLGPYAGAVVRGDGSLALAIDAYALASRLRGIYRRAGDSDAPPSGLPSSRRG